jgi:uncharacterized protein (TIGR00725 family)
MMAGSEATEMRRFVIGVVGAGDGARQSDVGLAFELGKLIAHEGWVLLSGGRNNGVMDAVNKGAREAKGLTIGILPTKDRAFISEAVDIPIITDMGSARNNINVLSSDVVIACGVGGAGTASEIALALKAKKPVILLNESDESRAFFKKIGGPVIQEVVTAQQAIEIAKAIVSKLERT